MQLASIFFDRNSAEIPATCGVILEDLEYSTQHGMATIRRQCDTFVVTLDVFESTEKSTLTHCTEADAMYGFLFYQSILDGLGKTVKELCEEHKIN